MARAKRRPKTRADVLDELLVERFGKSTWFDSRTDNPRNQRRRITDLTQAIHDVHDEGVDD